jgi:hypothetical protein
MSFTNVFLREYVGYEAVAGPSVCMESLGALLVVAGGISSSRTTSRGSACRIFQKGTSLLENEGMVPI